MNILSPEILIIVSTVCISLYYTLLKKFPGHMMILYFWLHAISYVAFSLLYIFRYDNASLTAQALKQLALDTSYTNFPLYLLSSAFMLGTYIILDILIKQYPMPTILALSQMSIIMATAGYLALGDTASTLSIIGIAVIFIGAIISGLESFSYKNPLQGFANYDKRLLSLSLIKAIFYTATLLITYICIAEYSETTKYILLMLTKHIHIPFTAIAPLHFNVGIQFANLLLMYLFVKYYLNETERIFSRMKSSYTVILPLAAFYILHAYFYYAAFDQIENKNFITAISKLYIPITLVLCHYLYQQKVSKEQVIGMSIIVLGSAISIFG